MIATPAPTPLHLRQVRALVVFLVDCLHTRSCLLFLYVLPSDKKGGGCLFVVVLFLFSLFLPRFLGFFLRLRFFLLICFSWFHCCFLSCLFFDLLFGFSLLGFLVFVCF